MKFQNIAREEMERESAASEVETAQPAQPKRDNLFRYSAACAGLIVLVAVILRSKHEGGGCSSDLNEGQWEDGEWQPRYCTLHHFQTSDLKTCMSRYPHVVCIGADKWAHSVQLMCPSSTTDANKDAAAVQQTTDGNSCSVEFISHPNSCEYNNAVQKKYIELMESSARQDPLLVIHQTLHHSSIPTSELEEYGTNPKPCKEELSAQLSAQLKLLAARPDSVIVQLASHPTWKYKDKSWTDSAQIFNQLYSSNNNSRLLYLSTAFETGFSQKSFFPPSPPTWKKHRHSPDADRQTQTTVPPELSLVLNTFCPSLLPSSTSSCCVHPSLSHHHYLTITILVFILAIYLGVGLILLSGATFAIIPHLEAVNFDLQAFISVLHSIGGGALVMLYILMADGTGYFLSVGRSYSPWLFLACVLAVVAVTALSNRTADSPQFLSRDQCNAWRGGMVLVYIALQYCSMDKVVAGRLFGELLVGGVVFTGGYTHFTHYWLHADFSWKRVATVLLRLNVLPILLSLTLGTSYGAYCLPLLLSLGFLFTSAFMASWPQMTPASMQGMSAQGPQHVVVAVKFGFAFLLISFLPWVKGLVVGVVSLPVLGSMLQSHTGDTDSLYHWMYTHRYMTLGGMVLGYVVCSVRSGSSGSSAVEGFRRLRAAEAGFSIAIMLGYGMFLLSAKDFAWSTESHSLIAVPVLVAYVLLRNLSETLQRCESTVLAAVGSSSVWLFVSSQHILLSQRGSAVLLLFPGLPRLANCLLVLSVFLFCQLLMSHAQHTLTQYAHPTSTQHRTPPLTV